MWQLRGVLTALQSKADEPHVLMATSTRPGRWATASA